jgi:hypothetical protein
MITALITVLLFIGADTNDARGDSAVDGVPDLVSVESHDAAIHGGDLDEVSNDTGENTVRAYLMTTSTSANISELHIVNTASGEQLFSGTLYNGDGEQLGGSRTKLQSAATPASGRLILTAPDLEQLFGVSPWRGPAMLEVTGSNSFEVITKLTSPSGLVSNTNCVRERSVSNVEGFDSNDMTYIRLINTSDATMGEVRGTLYDSSGNIIGTGNVVLADSIAPKAAKWLNRNQLIDLVADTWNGEARLEVADTSGLKLLNLNFINSETFLNFSCYEETSATRSRTACTDPRPEACTAEINQVCAERDNGIRCVTTPCPSIEWETYNNGCNACSDPLVYSYYPGSCEDRLLTD